LLFPLPKPRVRDYTAAGIFIQASPEDMESNEILVEQGYKALIVALASISATRTAASSGSSSAPTTAVRRRAKATNIQRAAEHLLKERLAAEKAAAAAANDADQSISRPKSHPCPLSARASLAKEDASRKRLTGHNRAGARKAPDGHSCRCGRVFEVSACQGRGVSW
jgi:hypothetical protein